MKAIDYHSLLPSSTGVTQKFKNGLAMPHKFYRIMDTYNTPDNMISNIINDIHTDVDYGK